MIYRLEIPIFNKDSGEIDSLEIYLEGGDESPCGGSFVDTLESLIGQHTHPDVIKDAIKVIKNLGAPDEEDHGWQEYFPYLRCPNLPGMAVQCTIGCIHPDHPELGEHKVKLTWIKVLKPYLRRLRELHDDLRLIKDEDKEDLIKVLRAK